MGSIAEFGTILNSSVGPEDHSFLGFYRNPIGALYCCYIQLGRNLSIFNTLTNRYLKSPLGMDAPHYFEFFAFCLWTKCKSFPSNWYQIAVEY